METQKHQAFLSLGSNLGDRFTNLHLSIHLLEGFGLKITKLSSIYETAAWGLTDQADFLNQVIEVETSVSPESLLEICLKTETQLGRERLKKWGPRTMDVDILFYDKAIVKTENLMIPHPFMHERRFVLLPLMEIAPTILHPELKLSTTELLKVCKDDSEVVKIEAL